MIAEELTYVNCCPLISQITQKKLIAVIGNNSNFSFMHNINIINSYHLQHS